MRDYIYIFLIALLSFCSCTPELSEQTGKKDNCVELTLHNMDMGTKAVDDPGTESERKISRLDIFFYTTGSSGNCLFHAQRTGLNSTSGTTSVSVYIPSEITNTLLPGNNDNHKHCDVAVIANLPEEITFNGTENTSKANLKSLVVSSDEFKNVVASDGSFNAPDNFLMYGEGTVSHVNGHAGHKYFSSDVNLTRAASKMTLRFWIPEYVMVDVKDENGNPAKDDYGNPIKDKWIPYFVDPSDASKGVSHMHMGFHKGITTTFIDPAPTQYNAEKVFETGYTDDFTYSRSEQKGSDNKNYHLYSCDVSFYSYAFSWTGEDTDIKAPFFTLMIPWVREGDSRYQTYYYQVVVNSANRNIGKNMWYDIELKVDQLGSRVQNLAYDLKDQSCYVLDWSNAQSNVQGGGSSDDINLKEWRYLVVPDTKIEMHNKTVGELMFDASHPVAYKMERQGGGLSAYYVDCSNKNLPEKQLTDINNANFSLSQNEEVIKFTHQIPENVYSPMHIHLKIWLDINPGGSEPDDIEKEYVTYLEFIQYPPIYIIPDKSSPRSIFVNGQRTPTDADLNNTSSDIKINNGRYNLGVAPGTSEKGESMYIINVSSFNQNDTLKYNGVEYHYLIADPRMMEPNSTLNNDGYNMNQQGGWVTDGKGRRLQDYYPTSTDGNAFRTIAPKFRISSPLSSGYSRVNKEGAAMRCASYQEDGFPAGRWRLPTMAEIKFIIYMQQQGQILELFYGTNYYFSSTNQVQYNQDSKVITYRNTTDESTGSVRCVYDDWYWGSEREAVKNNAYEGGYEFTWGDEPR